MWVISELGRSELSLRHRYSRAVSEFRKRLLALDERVFRIPTYGGEATYDVVPPPWVRASLLRAVLLPPAVGGLYFVVAIMVSPWAGIACSVVPALSYVIAVVTWTRRHRQSLSR
jgi:hypothetical protein